MFFEFEKLGVGELDSGRRPCGEELAVVVGLDGERAAEGEGGKVFEEEPEAGAVEGRVIS